ncbi:uncharacterized protein LOC143881996 [Tasmannia lanceolata]|uniref:uncharacterized protein LOC143881996 n=1 Tax=Tasmannia lanceolata TaxID=3420 RepID=UPI0040649923
MLPSLFRKLLQNSTTQSITHVFFFQNPSHKPFSHTPHTKTRPSFTVSYLINSCGLSKKAALRASQKVHLKSAEKPSSVLNFFKTHAFTQTKISILIKNHPSLLLEDPDKTLKPKLDFFQGLGVSDRVLSNVIALNPSMLTRNLDTQIIPSIDFLRTLVHTNKNVILILRRCKCIIRSNLKSVIKPNLSILQNQGVPESNISKLVTMQPRAVMLPTHKFNEVIKVVNEMGFDPPSLNFALALHVLATLSKSNWEGRLQVYKSMGLSEDEIISAFKLQPLCMMVSETKLRRVMDFFVSELGWEPSVISKYPTALLYSEKRIVPRCMVLEVLMSKGLIKKDLSLLSMLILVETEFLEKFVIKHQEKVPHLFNVYQDINDICHGRLKVR